MRGMKGTMKRKITIAAPAPLAGSRFTPEENAKILFAPCEWGGQSVPKKAE